MTPRRPPLERRPAGIIDNTVFPAEWVRRYGRPPIDLERRAEWIAHAIESGDDAPLPADDDLRALLDEVDEALAEDDSRSGYELRTATAAVLPAPTRKPRVGGDRIVGTLLAFNRRSHPLGGFVEEFDPGAFRDDHGDTGWRNVISLWNHRGDALLGSVAGGTLALKLEPHGITYDVTPPRNGIGGYVLEMVERGDARGASLAFRATKHQWRREGGVNIRRVTQARLGEASVVYAPAYPDATAEIRQRPRTGSSRQAAELLLTARRHRLASGRPIR
jgi:Escherichia/Staphylococcus phage prohead protease